MTRLAVVEVVALAAVAAPTTRLLGAEGLRRQFPRVWVAVALGVACWLALVAVLAALAPAGLHVLTVVALAAAALAAVRSRWTLRLRRRLPPGSLAPTTTLRALADRRFYLHQRARHGPVFKVAQARDDAVCVIGLERGHRLLREHAASLGPTPLPFSSGVTGEFVRYMDASTHRTYGPLLRRALGRPVVAAARDTASRVVVHELDSLAGARAAPLDAACNRIARDTLTFALFGMDPGGEASSRFSAPFGALARHPLTEAPTPAMLGALAELRALLREHTDALVASGDPATCGVVELRLHDPAQPDDVCLDNLACQLAIAIGNVGGLLRWLVQLLADNDDWVARVRQGEDDTLPARIVQETLRLAQSEYLYRTLLADVEHDGHVLPRGWLLRLCVWESHRDPAVFADPERFDPDRFLGREHSLSEYSPFGFGRHACSGSGLAEMIGAVLVEELCTRYDWVAVGGGPPEHDLRHADHWRPSSRLRVRLEPHVADALASPR